MKSVLISIHPKWCELIASGKKTVEVRKTKPKLEVPFKCYIYCTKGKGDCLWRWNGIWYDTQDPQHRPNRMDGKVIGEFVCKNMTYIDARIDSDGDRHLGNTLFLKNRMCLSDDELFDYLYKGEKENNGGWAWHISNLVIYHGMPRELSEFKREVNDGTWICREAIKRPPQSWCYVEGREE